MKKDWLIILILAGIIIIGYMWFAYANVYNRISAGGLNIVDNQYIYDINQMGTQKIKYAALGDSLTAGVGASSYENSYPYLLAKDMAKNNNEVILQDYSLLGARAEDVIGNLLDPVISGKPDIVTVLIGVNDVRERTGEDDFKNKYEYIVDSLLKQTNANVYLISLPFIGSSTVYLPPYDAYFRQRTIVFNKIIKEIAREKNLKYIDIATPTENIFKKDGPHYSVDSFHPSDEGYKILTQEIYGNVDY
ncbi:MAG: SGNH/GDSL hydrolase family protein [Candidatus Paceibacterota bacterium]